MFGPLKSCVSALAVQLVLRDYSGTETLLLLRALTFWGFYMDYNKETKSCTFWRGSEVSQVEAYESLPILCRTPRESRSPQTTLKP